MRMGILAVICIHMLLWAGCHSTPALHKLRSHENLLRRAVDSSQHSRGSWRKLLEENAANSDVLKEETVNTSVILEPKSVDERNATVEKDSGADDVKKEEAKPDPARAAPLTAQKEKGKSEGAVADDDHQKAEEPKSEGAASANKVEEPKSDVNQEASKEGRPKGDNVGQGDTRKAEKEKVELMKVEPIVHSQAVQIEEKANSSANVSDTKEGRTAQETPVQNLKEADSLLGDKKHGEAASTDQVAGEKATLVESKDAPNVDAEGSNVDSEDKDKPDKLSETVKEDSLPVALLENNKQNSTFEVEDKYSDEAKTSEERESKDNPTKEISDLSQNTESEEKLAEVNPIEMVTSTSSDVKEVESDKVVLTADPEGLDKEEAVNGNALANADKVDTPNDSTSGSSQETSKTGDAEVEDEKVDDKHGSSASMDIKEEKSEDGSEGVSQVQSDDENVEEKQERSDDDGNKRSESNDTETTEEKVEEGNTEAKDDENEDNDSKDASLAAKSDDETEAATKEVELQLEALKRDSVIETTVEQTQERDPSEDEYDIIQELADLPTKFHETAGKVADHLRPDVIKWTDTSKVYFNLANQQITESFSPLIGKQYAPFFASMISYGILLLPLIVVIVLFDHIKALFSLQKVLLFINIYLAAYFATLWLASFIIGLEPMSFFYLNSLSSYLSLQLLQGLGYIVYLILQTANVIHACTSDTFVGKLTSTLQWIVAMAIGLHYYVTVFHPAIASKPPHTSWKFYAIYTAAFFILCLFARIRWVKKEYVSSGRNIADKKS